MFAEESILVAKNWETVDDIIKAVEKLQQDLTNLLMSLPHDLARLDWWADGWSLAPNGVDQVYISNDCWWSEKNQGYGLWIGVETVTPGRVFGLDTPPGFYVWVWSRQSWPSLASDLMKALSQPKYELLGDLDARTSNGYVVRQPVQKYRPGEDVEAYGQALKEEIVEFFGHYASILLELDPIIQQHINKG